ncbi:SusD/RagB family nutrient-binding outer membrane lipoprotein [Cesiribacter sp. SM1]|uniref:SusD/RagB family nutrient-binding outer membrane lipoprotein n=1 Tax=Cesiribacter sp. SM1 TaxID=2861196 RepID=UPI001CD4DAD4|nr:SusD/RagB family nutrient-binding outer membrane lipoprotein [Cesiribacter sp. SM1]
MKRIYKNAIYLALPCLLVTSACEDFLDINDNPNNPTEASVSGLLVNSTFETAQNTYRLGSITSNYLQYLASPNQGSSSDIMDEVSHDNTWLNMYNAMTDLSVMIEQAESNGASHYQGAGQILQALHLGMMVDVWGDVPYSEAFNFETLTPAYDDDQALYTEVLSLLDAGISNLSSETTISMGNDDFIYGGDVDKWIKFGNMLKARYLNHLSKTAAYNPTEILAAVDQGFEGNEDDAQVVYFEEEFNPWANVAINNADLVLGGWISEQFIQATDGTTFGVVDPRLPYMVGATDDGEYVGTVNGAGRGNAPAAGARSTLVTGDFYSSEQSPVLIATYAEQKFIEAEAAFTVDKERSYQAYLAGIRAHMRKLGVAQEAIDAYINNPLVSMGMADFTIDDIFREKYVAMFLHPEAWVDARRYDYQYEGFTLPENANSALGGEFIRRLAYPDSEVSRNGRNVPDVSLTDRIWWDE